MANDDSGDTAKKLCDDAVNCRQAIIDYHGGIALDEAQIHRLTEQRNLILTYIIEPHKEDISKKVYPLKDEHMKIYFALIDELNEILTLPTK